MSDSASRRRLARAAKKLAAAGPLPPLVLMTDDARLPDPIPAVQALPRGSMVIVRCRDPIRRRALARSIAVLARAHGLVVLVAGDAALARRAHGIHLPEARLGEAARARACGHTFITASVHSLAALRRAKYADAVFLSPVFPTASHPGRAHLGPLRAAAMARLSPLPVYALGGITAANAGRLTGFCGLAAIGALAV